MKLMNNHREKGYIGMSFGLCLKAITLWKICQFRKILFRDIDGKCKVYYGCMTWWPR